MRRFNLSEWALANRTLVLYAMLVLAAIGAWSYSHLGQSEDPPFTFKAMVVRTLWPGATAEEVSRQVTERIEKKLMETGEYERIVSFSRPGESQVTFIARDSMRSYSPVSMSFFSIRSVTWRDTSWAVAPGQLVLITMALKVNGGSSLCPSLV